MAYAATALAAKFGAGVTMGMRIRPASPSKPSPKLLRGFFVLCLVFLYAPVMLLPLFAFNDSSIVGFPLRGFTLDWFRSLPQETMLHRAALNSLIIATATASISTCFAVLVARAITRYRFHGKGIAFGLIMAPVLLPEIIIGVALLIVLLGLGIPLNLWSVIGGHVLITMPFTVAIMLAAFHNMDQRLEEASLDLGESRFGTFRRVILPLAMPGLAASLLLSFSLSLDEFIIAFFLTGVDPTLPVYIWAQLRFPSKLPIVMALGTLMVLVSLVLLSLFEYSRRRWY